MVHKRSYANLRAYLRLTKTSQRTFAKRLGITPPHLCHILKGQRTPSLPLAARMASAANIPIESLLELAS